MDRLTRCPVCSSITTKYYPQYKCCVFCMCTSLHIKLKEEASKMGYVPVKTKWRCTHCSALNLGSLNNCRNCSYPRYGVIPRYAIEYFSFKRPQLQEDENV